MRTSINIDRVNGEVWVGAYNKFTIRPIQWVYSMSELYFISYHWEWGSSSHIAVICHSCLTRHSHLLVVLQLHSRFQQYQVACVSAICFYAVPLLYFSAWGVPPMIFLGKSYSALSQDSNTTSCIRAFLSVLDNHSPHSPAKVCKAIFWLNWLVSWCVWFLDGLRAGALCVCLL